MRALGLDIGEKRVGVAVSDPDARVATPVKVIDGLSGAGVSQLQRVIEDYEPGLIVVGLPRSLTGEEGPQAARVRQDLARLEGVTTVPIVTYDERMSSAEARKVMAASGMTERRQRGSVDMVAASIILQGYLDGDGPVRDGIREDG